MVFPILDPFEPFHTDHNILWGGAYVYTWLTYIYKERNQSLRTN